VIVAASVLGSYHLLSGADQSSAPAAAAPSGLTSSLIEGNLVYSSCTHSTLTVAGNNVCHDQSNVVVYACGQSGTCSASLKATMDSGYTFQNFEALGYAYVGTSSGTYTTSNPTTLYADGCSSCTSTLFVNGPVCSITITSVTVAYGGTAGSAQFSWTVSTVGSGTASYSITYYPLPNGHNVVVSPASTPQTVSGLTVPQSYFYSIGAAYACSGYHSSSSSSGDFWTQGGAAGPCPEGNVGITIPPVITTPGGAQLSWSESPSRSSTGAVDSFYWGLSNSYGFQTETPPSGSVYLQELQPATTYYYKIVASVSQWGTYCYDSGIQTGSFTTQSYTPPPVTQTQDPFTGTVTDQSGAPAPQGVVIEVGCNPSASYPGWSGSATSGETEAAGTYSIPAPLMTYPQYGQRLPCYGTFTLQLVPSSAWPGHWNETVNAYVPDEVDFSLQVNKPSAFVPATVAFVHTPYAAIQYPGSFYTDEAQSWGCTYCATSEISDIVPSYSGTAGASILIEAEYQQSGAFLFDGTNGRVVEILGTGAIGYYDPHGSEELQGQNAWTDWYSSPPTGGYCDSFQGPSSTWTMTLKGSYLIPNADDFSVGLAFGPLWTNVASTVSLQSTLGAASGHTSKITIDLTNPGTGLVYFEIYTDGPNSPSSAHNVVPHVWQVSSC
jgi:hypothetical protein